MSGSKANSNGRLVEDMGFVGYEVQPWPSLDKIQGASLGLVTGEGEREVKLAAALGPAQCRELAARLLLIADAADPNSRTIMIVTLASAWLPNQVLQVRDSPTGQFHSEFLMKSQLAVPEKPKLIIPG